MTDPKGLERSMFIGAMAPSAIWACGHFAGSAGLAPHPLFTPSSRTQALTSLGHRVQLL